MIPSASLFYKFDEVPLAGDSQSLDMEGVPYKPLNLAQDASSLASNSVSLTWDAPEDYGCDAITSYKIQEWSGAVWNDLVTGILTPDDIATPLTAGVTATLRVLAVNSYGDGVGSD